MSVYGKGSKVMWEKFADGRTVCHWYRDAVGFCLLGNCGLSPRRPCPKTQAQADKLRERICEEAIAAREVDDGRCPHGWDRRMSCSDCNKAAGGVFGTVDRGIE